ncbi:hypothetical protein DL98DRAFT_443101, partial [Cadophora sp. DSE1049]
NRIRRGISIRLLIYRILTYSIKTNLIDIKKFDEIKAELLYNNKLFILNTNIKYIRWLLRAASLKSASTIIIKFTNPEDVNKIINKGLI